MWWSQPVKTGLGTLIKDFSRLPRRHLSISAARQVAAGLFFSSVVCSLSGECVTVSTRQHGVSQSHLPTDCKVSVTAGTKNASAWGLTEHRKANFLMQLLTFWTDAKKIPSLSEGALRLRRGVPLEQIRPWGNTRDSHRESPPHCTSDSILSSIAGAAGTTFFFSFFLYYSSHFLRCHNTVVTPSNRPKRRFPRLAVILPPHLLANEFPGDSSRLPPG